MNQIFHLNAFSMIRSLRSLFTLLVCTLWLSVPLQSHAQSPSSSVGSREVTQLAQVWIDTAGKASIEQVAGNTAGSFQPIGQSRNFSLTAGSALWMRFDLPAADTSERWYLLLSAAATLDRATLYQRTASGSWKEQRAGDRLAVASWDIPEQTPVFHVNLESATTVWLRLENFPATLTTRVQILTQTAFDSQRRWTLLLLGGYFGFGLLVLLLGIMHVQLYADRTFVAYSAYVASMYIFQLTYTGIGGLYFWPNSPAWNTAASPFFMLLLASIGIWFVREASSLMRYSKFVDRAVMAIVFFGLIFAVIYTLRDSKTSYLILNLYGLLSVIVSISVCFFVWKRGERYGKWIFLGFLPVYLTYPFPALRSAGVISNDWLSQYALVIGSAIEIPLLLYILHMRAKEFNENHARMRAIDQTDPLTGLAISPVLTLRVRDAIQRTRKSKHRHTLILIELFNHAEIVRQDGRQVGDRALIVAASRLLSCLKELDTLCRVDDFRFAVLVENSLDSYAQSVLAQRIVACGLSEPVDSSGTQVLRFRVVTAALQPKEAVDVAGKDIDLDSVLAPLVQAMNSLAQEPKKTIVHLDPSVSAEEMDLQSTR